MACGWTYEEEQARLQMLMERCLREDDTTEAPDFDDEEEEGEEDSVEFQDHHSDTEQEISDSEVDEFQNQSLLFIGKDKKTTWSKLPILRREKYEANKLVKDPPGVKPSVKSLKKESEIWSHFFSDATLNKIVKCTNKHIQVSRTNYQRERDCKDTDILEVKALIGLLYLAGVLKSNRLDSDEMWNNNGTGVEIFRLTMSQTRFHFLLRRLRFDDLATCNERKRHDKFAPIREVFDDFVYKCNTAYSPSEYCTVDEKLEAFLGRCSFRQNIPRKPVKYGIKIFALADSKTFYTINLEVYTGRQPEGPFAASNSPIDVVQRLCQPIKGSGRNVTVDNWFTSLELLDILQKKFKLTLLGAVSKNKRELPLEFACPSSRRPMSSMFAFRKNATLVSHMPEKNKNVLLLSNIHCDDEINEHTNKPEMIMHYNMTKGGVDCVDKLCAAYNVSRNTRKWSMVVFYSLLNIAGINTFIIYSANNSAWNSSRRKFLRELSFQLIEGHLRRRATLQIPGSIKLRITEILGLEAPQLPVVTAVERGRCVLCDRKKNRPTRFSCVKCQKFLCLEHSQIICRECLAPTEDSE